VNLVNSWPERVDHTVVELSQCPYDGTPISVESLSGGSMLLSCDACTAAWEWHGAWIGRVRAPDRERVLAARRARIDQNEPVVSDLPT